MYTGYVYGVSTSQFALFFKNIHVTFKDHFLFNDSFLIGFSFLIVANYSWHLSLSALHTTKLSMFELYLRKHFIENVKEVAFLCQRIFQSSNFKIVLKFVPCAPRKAAISRPDVFPFPNSILTYVIGCAN